MSNILVIAEHRSGVLRPVSLELIAGAQTIKQAGDKVVVAVIGAQADKFVSELSVEGADELVVVKSTSTDFDPDIFEGVVAGLIQDKAPKAVLIPHSVDSYGYAATLAAKAGHGFATDVFKLEYEY
jgi:electron transfer flavoprotein alpha subunit